MKNILLNRTNARNRYRLKVGIPLDAPLQARGRPTVEEVQSRPRITKKDKLVVHFLRICIRPILWITKP